MPRTYKAAQVSTRTHARSAKSAKEREEERVRQTKAKDTPSTTRGDPTTRLAHRSSARGLALLEALPTMLSDDPPGPSLCGESALGLQR